MNIEKMLLDIVGKDMQHKFEYLNSQLEILIEILPGTVQLDASRRFILNTYFEAETEKEALEMINYIVEHINLLRINHNNIISMVYSQMEGILLHKVKQMNKIREYKDYIREEKGSIFKKGIEFLLQEKQSNLSNTDQIIVDCIDDLLRKERNSMMHNMYEVFEYEDALELIADGSNLDRKLTEIQNAYIKKIHIVYDITKKFFGIIGEI